MNTYKDIGITFKQINLNEADKIISVLTKHHGRVDCIAKGIRKITSRKAGNIDLMSFSRFAFAKGKSLDIVTEAELIDGFNKLKKKLKSTFRLFYICELIDNFVKVGENKKQVFDLLVSLLTELQGTSSSFPVRSF